ncbi:MAG: DUF5333 domain-containing protein [Pseudomonadota bacterium]
MARAPKFSPLAMCVAAATLIGAAAPAQAQAADYTALRDDPEIENGVLIVAIGDMIQEACPSFEDRRARAIPFLLGLAGRARDLGYTDDEIRAYIDDDTEKARVRARAVQWFAQQGGSPDTPESICEIARAEIDAGSSIGRLIRER